MLEIPFLSQLASQGLLALLLAISIFANAMFVKIILEQAEKRVADAKELGNKILDPLTAIKANGDLLITLFQNVLKNGK